MEILIANIRRDKPLEGYTPIYVGRGKAPNGMENAGLGNPYPVAEYGRDKCIEMHLDFLRDQYRAKGPSREKLEQLAKRAKHGEKLQLFCWCAPSPCHAANIKRAIEGIASRL